MRHPARIAAVVYDPVSPPSLPEPTSRTDIHIAMIGRIAPWKGQDLFLEAFAQAFPLSGPTATIAGGPLFGEIEYEANLHRRARELGLGGRVTFTGHVADVTGILAACDVAVHASTTPEPFGLVVVEAMAAGKAVVAADAGGPAEIITHDVDGLLYEMGAVGALAAALHRLEGDPALRARLGAAAQVRAGDFAPGKVADQVLDVYRSVIGVAASSG